MTKPTDKTKKKQMCDLQTEKIAKKFYLTKKKKLGKIDYREHSFGNSTKIFASENLTPINESTAYNCRKLKRDIA